MTDQNEKTVALTDQSGSAEFPVLSGTIGPDDADNFSAFDFERDVL